MSPAAERKRGRECARAANGAREVRKDCNICLGHKIADPLGRRRHKQTLSDVCVMSVLPPKQVRAVLTLINSKSKLGSKFHRKPVVDMIDKLSRHDCFDTRSAYLWGLDECGFNCGCEKLGKMKMPNAIGEVPTWIVATTVLLGIAMTDTVWSSSFAT